MNSLANLRKARWGEYDTKKMARNFAKVYPGETKTKKPHTSESRATA